MGYGMGESVARAATEARLGRIAGQPPRFRGNVDMVRLGARAGYRRRFRGNVEAARLGGTAGHGCRYREGVEVSHFRENVATPPPNAAAGYRRDFRGNAGNARNARDRKLPTLRWLAREATSGYGREPSDADRASGPGSDPARPTFDAGCDAGSAPGSDPAGARADRLLELADEIVTLSAHIQAATARLLELLAEFDRLGGWRAEGHRTSAYWLAHHTGLDLGAAREKVRVARALEGLPDTRATFASGELNYAKVRAMTRVATPENETDLLDYAKGSSAAGVERLVRSWREHDGLDEAALERERHRSRRLTVVPDDAGMYLIRGRLDPEVGAVLVRALDAAEDALFARDRKRQLEALDERVRAELGGGLSAEARALIDPVGALEPEVTPVQRRADALGLVAEQALEGGFGAECGADEADAPPRSGSRARRYEVVLHVERATLAADDAPGVSELEDGVRVSAETSRRLTCDAAVRTMTHAARADVDACGSGGEPIAGRGSKGDACGRKSKAADHRTDPCDCEPTAGDHRSDPCDRAPQAGRGHTLTALGPALDVGRSRRTIPPALRRALEFRDRGCRFPGCGSRFAEGHHIIHWVDGGTTSLDNLVLVCIHHHRLVHEDGFTVRMDGRGEPAFAAPSGIPLPSVPHYDARGRLEALLAANRARGVVPDFRTGRTRWPTLDDVPPDVRQRLD